MSGKDAEIERAFERAEKDEERRPVSNLLYDGKIPIWDDPTPCPRCGELASLKMKPGKRWVGVCLPCNRYWPLEGDDDG